ncbi:MAG: SET domain-containing protein-lysine N-methyltransferase, partial [Planctomycetia bacterium]|nr:SET domain-containing protein-lysine N-methyltransferase [Planctomycetia bacterium]
MPTALRQPDADQTTDSQLGEGVSTTPAHNRARRRDRLTGLIRVGDTDVGNGIFARRRLKAELILGEILGEIMDDYPEDPSYCMALPSGKLLEPAPPLRFLNHSCDPNCEIFYYEADEGEVQEDRLWLQTIRPIKAGEQLLIDYGWPADAAIPCHCGADGCRGWIC